MADGDDDFLDEPTEVGLVRHVPFKPERVFLSAAMEHGAQYVLNIGREARFAEQLAGEDVPLFPYEKLELPRDPQRKKKDPLSLDAIALYADYDASDEYLDALREELRRPDGREGATHTDVLVRERAYAMKVPVHRIDGADVFAVGLSLPSDYPVPVYTRVLPELTHCLLHNLIEYHQLAGLTPKEQLTHWSTLAISDGPLTPGNPRERLYCAALLPLDAGPRLEGTLTLQNPAMHKYRKLEAWGSEPF